MYLVPLRPLKHGVMTPFFWVMNNHVLRVMETLGRSNGIVFLFFPDPHVPLPLGWEQPTGDRMPGDLAPKAAAASDGSMRIRVRDSHLSLSVFVFRDPNGCGSKLKQVLVHVATYAVISCWFPSEALPKQRFPQKKDTPSVSTAIVLDL